MSENGRRSVANCRRGMAIYRGRGNKTEVRVVSVACPCSGAVMGLCSAYFKLPDPAVSSSPPPATTFYASTQSLLSIASSPSHCSRHLRCIQFIRIAN